MARAKRRLNATAVVLSIVAHAVVLTTLALHAPRLVRPQEQAGPPEPIIPVLIMPRTPPAPPGATEKPKPIRLHRRQLRRDAQRPDVAPFIVPPTLPTPPPVQPRTSGQPRYRVQPSPSERVASALRGSAVGCANPDLLSPGERERCDERFGSGALQARHLGPAATPELEGAAAAREAGRRSRGAQLTPGPADTVGSSGPAYRNRMGEPPPLSPLTP